MELKPSGDSESAHRICQILEDNQIHLKNKAGTWKSCLIFAVTKQRVERLAIEIRNYFKKRYGLKNCIAAVNHSGGDSNKFRNYSIDLTSNVETKINFQRWSDGKFPILVATSSCGLGLDKKNLNLVIHYGLPLNLTDYQQQTGRAGRGHQLAKCGMLAFDPMSAYSRINTLNNALLSLTMLICALHHINSSTI